MTSRFFRKMLFRLTVVSSALCFPYVHGEGRSRPSGGLSIDRVMSAPKLTIRPNKPEYKVGEAILIDLRLYNVTNKDLYLYLELQREGWLITFALVNVETAETVYRSPFVRPKRRKTDSHFAILTPGSFAGHFYAITPPSSGFPEGNYVLQAAYTNLYEVCLVNMNFSGKEIQALGEKAYVRLWTGQVISNQVPIRIKGKLGSTSKRKKKKRRGFFRRSSSR